MSPTLTSTKTFRLSEAKYVIIRDDDSVPWRPGVNRIKISPSMSIADVVNLRCRFTSLLVHLHIADLEWIRWWTSHVAVCCKSVPSGGGGALLPVHSGTALKSELCGAGLFPTDSGTALTGGPSIFISVSHSKATLASRFLERKLTIRIEKTTSQTKFTSETGTVTTGTDGGEASAHKDPRNSQHSPTQKRDRGHRTLSRQTIQTDSFTASLDLFLFSLHLPLPTSTFLFLRFRVHLLSFFSFTLHILPQPTAEKFSSCMAWYSRSKAPSLGKVFYPPTFSFLAIFHTRSFLHYETSHLKLSPEAFSALLPGDPSFSPFSFSILSHSWQEPFPLRFVLTFSHTLCYPCSPA